MRTREPSCNVAAAGAGDCAAVFAGEEDGADSRPDAAVAAADAGHGTATSAASQFVVSMAVGAETEGAVQWAGGARAAHVDCGCDGALGLPHTRTTAVNITPCVAAAEASAASSPRMQPARHSVRCRSKRIANSNGSALAFQHQLKRRRVAEHAVGRQAEKPLHVTNRAARRSLDNKHAAAVAATASNSHLDRMWRENGACSVGGGGRLLHRTIAILKSPRERQIEREREKSWGEGV